MNYLVLLLVLISIGCVRGEKRKGESPLSYLDGEKYGQTVSVGNVPVVLEKRQTSIVLKGQLLVGSQAIPLPFRYQQLALLKKNTEVKRVTTQPDGKFLFAGDFDNGDYQIKLLSPKYKASTLVEVKNQSVENITLIAEPHQGI